MFSRWLLAILGGLLCANSGSEASQAGGTPLQGQSSGHVIRTFRMAVGATGEFTEYWGGKEEALQAVEWIMGRVSKIFEREVGVRFELVPEVENLVFENPETDPFSTNEPSLELMREAQETFDTMVGTENYDIGIVLTTGVYGLNQLATVCNPDYKGASSFGLPEPDGSDFHVNMIVHELAHQFGAEHTFNSVSGICSDRRREWRAFEPGSGSTLMSYAGLPCGSDGFQATNDNYFHSESLKQIIDFLNSPAAGCAEIVQTGNHPPNVHAGPEYTIPMQTPFALTASASDPEGDGILYQWEQRDRGPARAWDAPDDGMGPLFRSYAPTASPTRVFPALEFLLRNEQAPGEILPSTTRVMRFRVTARDDREQGAFSWSDTQIWVTDKAGPFRVSSHAAPEVLGERTEVRWNVGGTTAAPVSASEVRISLSLDGGETFPIILAETTANDGVEEVTLPDVESTRVRIKVEAVGNIFFAVNDAELTLNSSGLRISEVQRTAEGLRLSWSSVPETEYRIESRSDLSDGSWETVKRVVASGEMTATDLDYSRSREFFRVVQE